MSGPTPVGETGRRKDTGEIQMGEPNIVCPFYAKGEEFCEVGNGYISPHDVNVIIRYCSCRFSDCLKYRELMDRFPIESPTEAVLCR